jgi:hypothetical protein
MAKLKLVANPTFKAKVGIPVAGEDVVEVEMTFKHRTKAALDTWMQGRADRTDVQAFMETVVAWELEDPFNEESVTLLTENYIGAALATFKVYISELMKAPEKN